MQRDATPSLRRPNDDHREGYVKSYLSWGRSFRYQHRVRPLYWRHEDPEFLTREAGPFLPYGYGRSYGDSCLNDGGTLVDTSGMSRLMAFDETTGVLRCEAGVSLASILEFATPRGFFLPVSPGTKFVSVGGAIANDIHGKNHHRAGTFGCHVQAFELLRSSGERLICTPTQNAELFRATVGGLGLTGIITWADITLKRVPSPLIRMESIRFGGLEEFEEIARESDQDFEYTVAWVDCLAQGASLGRGIFMRGNHAPGPSLPRPAGSAPRLVVPIDAPGFLLNRLTISAFNAVYYNKQRQKMVRKDVTYDPFFYPLDAVHQWNRIYGRRGFFQYQFVLPLEERDALRRVFEMIARSGFGSFLAVLKMFGDRPSPGMLSFPAAGMTLALDFPNVGMPILRLFQELTRLIVAHGGRLYPAKDAVMDGAAFRQFYPRLPEFTPYIDPKFSSSFWRRVTERT